MPSLLLLIFFLTVNNFTAENNREDYHTPHQQQARHLFVKLKEKG